MSCFFFAIPLLTLHRSVRKRCLVACIQDDNHIFPVQYIHRIHSRLYILVGRHRSCSARSLGCMNIHLALYNFLFRMAGRKLAHKIYCFCQVYNLICIHKYCHYIHRYRSLKIRKLLLKSSLIIHICCTWQQSIHNRYMLAIYVNSVEFILHKPIGHVGTQKSAKFFTWLG